jgi:hypothetical protein
MGVGRVLRVVGFPTAVRSSSTRGPRVLFLFAAYLCSPSFSLLSSIASRNQTSSLLLMKYAHHNPTSAGREVFKTCQRISARCIITFDFVSCRQTSIGLETKLATS